MLNRFAICQAYAQLESDYNVRDIYMRAVLRWNLPMDAELKDAIRATFVPEFLAQFPQIQGE